MHYQKVEHVAPLINRYTFLIDSMSLRCAGTMKKKNGAQK